MPGFSIPQPTKIFVPNGQLPVFPARTFMEPKEGKRFIPIEIDWDGSGSTYDVNLQQLTQQPFSQIVMLDVDNTSSGADVTFLFPDSTDTLLVPAYEAGTFPVFSNALELFASAPAALSTDITRVRVLNFRQEPLSNPPPQFHNIITTSGIALTGGGTTALLAAGVRGTLIGYNAFGGALAGAGTGNANISLKDHTSAAVLDGANIELGNAQSFNGLVLNSAGFSYRFSGGIDMVIATGGTAFAGGSLVVSLKYRAP